MGKISQLVFGPKSWDDITCWNAFLVEGVLSELTGYIILLVYCITNFLATILVNIIAKVLSKTEWKGCLGCFCIYGSH